jgi:hypothetical protein
MHLLITILGFGNAVKVGFPELSPPGNIQPGRASVKHTAYVVEVLGEEA